MVEQSSKFKDTRRHIYQSLTTKCEEIYKASHLTLTGLTPPLKYLVKNWQGQQDTLSTTKLKDHTKK